MTRKTLLGAALLASLPAFAQDQAATDSATANSYSYVELSGQMISFDEEILGADGALGAGVTLSVQPLRYAFGFLDVRGYRNTGDDAELTIGMVDIGAGLIYPVATQVDVLATAAYTSQQFEACINQCAEIDADGYVVGGGLRIALNDRFDLLAKYENETLEVDGTSGESESYSSARLELTGGQGPHGIVAGAEIDEDQQAIYKLGYRYTFN